MLLRTIFNAPILSHKRAISVLEQFSMTYLGSPIVLIDKVIVSK